MGISSIPLGISGGEDGVDKHEGTNDLGAQPSAFAVASGEGVCAATILVEMGLIKSLDQPYATYGSQALSHHVHHRPHQRYLPSQEQPERHRRVNVTTCVRTQEH